jgi:DNA-directed RNA polymerase subunit RPC12/RpoP
MTLYKYKCQQCGLIVEMPLEQAQLQDALRCPTCAKTGSECSLVPSCGMECAKGAPCTCAVPGFACS